MRSCHSPLGCSCRAYSAGRVNVAPVTMLSISCSSAPGVIDRCKIPLGPLRLSRGSAFMARVTRNRHIHHEPVRCSSVLSFVVRVRRWTTSFHCNHTGSLDTRRESTMLGTICSLEAFSKGTTLDSDTSEPGPWEWTQTWQIRAIEIRGDRPEHRRSFRSWP